MASPVSREPRMSTTSRVTKDNRKLTYQLRVIQEPERARACGSGAKSSADRRPVDPPPVVELKIFEGDNPSNLTDITFQHNANFFLYATLDAARPMAHGRLPAAQTSHPVLTGFPVSSMAYLDRPTAAGYFIFPDLSVRHEGKYKLNFNLFEEVKEAKDIDAEPAHNHPNHPKNLHLPTGPMDPKEHYDWRIEVSSSPFTVYSAKKFPGLAESTALSRIVAEQGCRVRIRRDVRMRRRDNKRGSHDDYSEEHVYNSSGDAPTPDAYQQNALAEASDRRRSASNATAEPPAQYAVERRPSTHETPYGSGCYTPNYAAQSATQGAPSTYAHGPYGTGHAPSQAPAQPPHHAPSFPPSMHQTGNPASSMYAETQCGYGQAPQRQMSGPQGYTYPAEHQSQAQQYQATQVSNDRQTGYATQYSSNNNKTASGPYGYQGTGYYMNGATSQTEGARHDSVALAPLKMPASVDERYESNHSPGISQHGSRSTTAMPSPSYESTVGRTMSYGSYSAPSAAPQPTATTGGKRGFSSAFESSHLDHSLSNGMRPNETLYGADPMTADYDDDYESTFEMLKMQYKRADGTEISRKLTTSR